MYWCSFMLEFVNLRIIMITYVWYTSAREIKRRRDEKWNTYFENTLKMINSIFHYHWTRNLLFLQTHTEVFKYILTSTSRVFQNCHSKLLFVVFSLKKLILRKNFPDRGFNSRFIFIMVSTCMLLKNMSSS